MSELAVGSLKGLAANGFVIDVAPGSKVVQPGGILQVVSTTKVDTFTTTSDTYTAVTGLAVSITPSSASSKVLLFARVNFSNTNTTGDQAGVHVRLSGGNAGTYVGAAASSRVQSASSWYSRSDFFANEVTQDANLVFLDSPATTSATSYGVEIRRGIRGTATVNRSGSDRDDASNGRMVSSIVAMEVAG